MGALVSIVTTTFREPDNLRKIAEQVGRQDYADIEYIVVNGGDDAETLEVLEQIKVRFGDGCKIITEPDTGLYNALNKGIRLASGEIIGCLFDEFTSEDAISRMVAAMETEGTDGVHADLNYMDGGRVVRKWHQGQGNIRTGWLPGHPTLYLKRSVYEKYGLYKEDYKISADYEFMIRCLKDGQVRLSYIPEVLIHMAYGGTSNRNFSAYLMSLKEGHRALKENGIPFAFFTDICRTLRVLLQFK